MRKDSPLLTYYYQKLPKYQQRPGTVDNTQLSPEELPYHPITNPKGYKGTPPVEKAGPTVEAAEKMNKRIALNRSNQAQASGQATIGKSTSDEPWRKKQVEDIRREILQRNSDLAQTMGSFTPQSYEDYTAPGGAGSIGATTQLAATALPVAASSVAIAAPIVGASLKAPLLGTLGAEYGSAALTGNNLINSYFAYEGAKKAPYIYNAFGQMANNPSWSNLGNAAGQTAVTALEVFPFLHGAYQGLFSVAQDARQVGQYLTPRQPQYFTSSEPEILGVQHGMDALPPGYNHHMFERTGYRPPTTDPNLAPALEDRSGPNYSPAERVWRNLLRNKYDIEPPPYPGEEINPFATETDFTARNQKTLQNWFNKAVPETPVAQVKPWSLQEPTDNILIVKSTKKGSPLEKQLNKNGEINVNNIRAHISKTDVGAQDKYILEKVLDEKFPGQTKIDYNLFRQAVTDELATFDKDLSPQYQRHLNGDLSGEGLGRLGFPKLKKSSYEGSIEALKQNVSELETEIKNAESNPAIVTDNYKTPKQKEQYLEFLRQDLLDSKNKISTYTDAISQLPPEVKTVTYKNPEKLGLGNASHFTDENTLGHSRYYVTTEEPSVAHILEDQSDWGQGSSAIKKLDAEQLARKKNTLEQFIQEEESTGDRFGQLPRFKSELLKVDLELKAHNDLFNSPFSKQKQFLAKNLEERLLQESIAHQAKLGRTKMRYPTGETAIKIQDYNHPRLIGEEKVNLLKKNGKLDIKDYPEKVQGIIKKYNDKPKMIKKLLGVEPKLVIDEKGNSWYEFDIPKSYLEGKAEIIAFKEGGLIKYGPGGPILPGTLEKVIKDYMTSQQPTPVPVNTPIEQKPAVEEYKGVSIVDYLKSKGQSSDKGFRKGLAKQSQIENYDYSAEKNTELLNKLRANPEILNSIQPTTAPISPIVRPRVTKPAPTPVQGMNPAALNLMFSNFKTPTKFNAASVIPSNPFGSMGFKGKPKRVVKKERPADESVIQPVYNNPISVWPYNKTPQQNEHIEMQGFSNPNSIGAGNVDWNFANNFVQEQPQTNIPTFPKVGSKSSAPLKKQNFTYNKEKPFSTTPVKKQSFGQFVPPVYSMPRQVGESTISSDNIRQKMIEYGITNNIPVTKTPEDFTDKLLKGDWVSIGKETFKGIRPVIEFVSPDLAKQGDTYFRRQDLKNNDNLQEAKTKLTLPTETSTSTTPAIITGDTIHLPTLGIKGRYIIPSQIDLKQTSWGIRNRGDYTPIETEGGDITLFNNFVPAKEYFKNNTNTPDNASFIGVDNKGKVVTGTKKDFTNSNIPISRTYSNKIVDFATDANGKLQLTPSSSKASNKHLSPVTINLDDTGKQIKGSMNLLIPKKNKTTNSFGDITGGRVIFTTPDGKESVFASGSADDIAAVFKNLKAKGNYPYLTAFTLDNGTYGPGLRKINGKITSEDLKAYQGQNSTGSVFLYLKNGNYSRAGLNTPAPKLKYKDISMTTPNIRTEKDSSYIKGHPLVNEQKAIVLHHTGYSDTTGISKGQSKAMKGVIDQFSKPGESSHVVIDFNGTRYNYAKPSQVTFHAGKSMLNGRENVNDFGVGIEFQGDTSNKPLTDAQIESFIEYIAPIIKDKKIPLENIITHKQIRTDYMKAHPEDKQVLGKPDVNERDYKRIIQALKKKGIYQSIPTKKLGGSIKFGTEMTVSTEQLESLRKQGYKIEML